MQRVLAIDQEGIHLQKSEQTPTLPTPFVPLPAPFHAEKILPEEIPLHDVHAVKLAMILRKKSHCIPLYISYEKNLKLILLSSLSLSHLIQRSCFLFCFMTIITECVKTSCSNCDNQTLLIRAKAQYCQVTTGTPDIDEFWEL